jgi:hypothetical protein
MFANLATRAGGSAAAMPQASIAAKPMTALAKPRRLRRPVSMASSPLFIFLDDVGCKKYTVARSDCDTRHIDRSIRAASVPVADPDSKTL